MKYRGHEITRTGSINMFQAPQPDIVMNPLSNFSRPRNKYSPPGSFNRQDGADSYHKRTDTADSAVSLPSRSESPSMRSGSPISSRSIGSRASRASRQFTIVTEDSLPKAEGKKEVTSAPPVAPTMRTTEPPVRARDIKKTASVSLEKTVDDTAETETRKKRRHTFSWKRMSGMNQADAKPDLEAPKEEPAAVEAEKPRPKSTGKQPSEQMEATAVDKGKGREVVHDHPQAIGVKCCDKCGKIRKVHDSKVLASSSKAQDGLVVAGPSAYKLIRSTDDSLGSNAVNPAGAANAAQLLMHRQRRPKPEPPAALPKNHVVKDFASTSNAESPRIVRKPVGQIVESPVESVAETPVETHVERPVEDVMSPPRRITRFASLYGISQEKEIAPSMPTLNTNVSRSEGEETPQMKATSTPIDEPLPEFVSDPANDEDESDLRPPKRYSFESQLSVLHVGPSAPPLEMLKSAPEVVPRATQPIDLSKPIVLPPPNLGVHFARSSMTLRGLVLPLGRSSSNLLEDMGASGNTDEIHQGLEQSDRMNQMREKHQSRVGEIMAI